MINMEIDTASNTWKAIKKSLHEEIEKGRDELERPGLDPLVSERVRGRVQMARKMLALSDKRPPQKPQHGLNPDPRSRQSVY